MRLLCLLLGGLLITAPAFAFHPRLLFDQGHGQAFVIEQTGELQLSRLARTFTDQGYEVSSTNHPLNAALLENCDALIISGAFKPFTSTEILEVRRFVERGGHLVVMVHIGPPLLKLLHAIGVDVANGVIRETHEVIANEPLNFRTTDLRPHPLTRNLKQFSLYGSWPLRPLAASGQILAYSSNDAWVDLSGDRRRTPGDAVQAFGVVVANRIGKGEVLVFGDDAIFQNRFLTGSNQRLAENLGRWLAAARQPDGTEI